MKVLVIGAGYVGLVTAAGLADSGHHVILAERNPKRVEQLRRGRLPFYEPGLQDLVQRGMARGSLSLTAEITDLDESVHVVMVAVGTPSSDDGRVDLGAFDAVMEDIAAHVGGPCVVCIKSTVPVGTADRVQAQFERRGRRDLSVVSAPEFLAEGSAITDFLEPDRVVVGTRDDEAGKVMRRLYAPLLRRGVSLHLTDCRSAEMSKYASNAMLAARLSMINEIARMCQAMGADIDVVRRIVGDDSRIGAHYLHPGLGWGGSCLPKDVRALAAMGAQCGIDLSAVAAVGASNEIHLSAFVDRIEALLNAVENPCVAVLGLAFKPGTDDVRESPAQRVVGRLHTMGAILRLYDPVACERFEHLLPTGQTAVFAPDAYACVEGADLVVICTEWREFAGLDLGVVAQRMRGRILVDGRNIVRPGDARAAGLEYHGVGRPYRVARTSERL